jgi:hypothetical protein
LRWPYLSFTRPATRADTTDRSYIVGVEFVGRGACCYAKNEPAEEELADFQKFEEKVLVLRFFGRVVRPVLATRLFLRIETRNRTIGGPRIKGAENT